LKIDKAIKKEKSNSRVFFIIMTIIFIVLPLVAYLSQTKHLFMWIYLAFVEILIIFAIITKINQNKLKFNINNNKLKFKSGVFSKESIILCDKVVVVHTDKSKEDMDIILITINRFRNPYLKPITKGFIKKYSEASEEYLKIKKISPEEVYYFQVIRRGSLKKYILLDEIFKNCVKANYTASAIENIKIARAQIEL
jgi:energy-coupling factor transporter transmembrane protein EcfT